MGNFPWQTVKEPYIEFIKFHQAFFDSFTKSRWSRIGCGSTISTMQRQQFLRIGHRISRRMAWAPWRSTLALFAVDRCWGRGAVAQNPN
jgi:hypothetical protein